MTNSLVNGFSRAKTTLPLIALFFLLMLSEQSHSQAHVNYIFDTIQIEQLWKKHLTGEKDTSYLKVCIPSNDVKPDYDGNYDGFVIICSDGSIIRLNTMPIIPSTIVNDIVEDLYGDTIANCFGENLIDLFQREYFDTHILDKPKDSSLYHPQRIVLEGTHKNGLYWKIVRLEYVCVSYENVPSELVSMYDTIINEYRFLKKDDVTYYRQLPLYK